MLRERKNINGRKEGEKHDAPPFIEAIVASTGAIKERRSGKGRKKIETISIRSVSTG